MELRHLRYFIAVASKANSQQGGLSVEGFLDLV